MARTNYSFEKRKRDLAKKKKKEEKMERKRQKKEGVQEGSDNLTTPGEQQEGMPDA